MFCPANWRQQPDELAFVIDDLAPAVVVWQEEEVGPSVRAGRAAPAHDARWIRHDADGDATATASTRRSSPPGAPTIPTPTSPPTRRCCSIYTAAFAGRPNAAMLPSRALIAQGLLMAPWSGIDDRVRVPQLGAAVPHRDVHAEPLDVRDGRHQRVRPARPTARTCAARSTGYGATGGFVVGPMVDAIVEANADGRYDLSTFRGRRGNPVFDAWVQPDPSPWGRHAGGYGQSEVMGMATFNLLAPDGHRIARPAVAARRPARRRPGRRRGRGRASRARSSCGARRSCAATGTGPS